MTTAWWVEKWQCGVIHGSDVIFGDRVPIWNSRGTVITLEYIYLHGWSRVYNVCEYDYEHYQCNGWIRGSAWAMTKSLISWYSEIMQHNTISHTPMVEWDGICKIHSPRIWAPLYMDIQGSRSVDLRRLGAAHGSFLGRSWVETWLITGEWS